MSCRAIPAILLVFCLSLPCVHADESPAEEAIREAITVLEARKSQVEKKEDKDKIAKAIADLEKLLPPKKGADPKDGGDLGKFLTPALLKKKFAGKAAFNPKTGELTLVYDFSAKEQLKDFDLKDAKPTLKAGALRVGPTEEIRHAVKFKTLKATAQIVVENVGAGKGHIYLRTSEDVKFWVLPVNGVWTGYSLAAKADELAKTKAINQDQVGGKPQQVSLVVEPKKVVLKVGGEELSGKVDLPAAGHLELHGGLGGLQVKSLVLSGVPDPEWAKEFFKE
jgi:hypothetical protein